MTQTWCFIILTWLLPYLSLLAIKFMVSGCVYVCVALHVSIPSFTRNYEETQMPIDVQHCPDDLKSSSGLQMYID